MRPTLPRLLLACLVASAAAGHAAAAVIWVEGEKPERSKMKRFPQWYDQVKRDLLSGGDFISNWGDQPGEASYRVEAPAAGTYELWVRANPIQSRLSYRVGAGTTWTPIDLEKTAEQSTNVAADGKPDLRFLAWARVGPVMLAKGANAVFFRMDSGNNNHGMLDCFALADESFRPSGIRKPGQVEVAARGWVPFDPPADAFSPASAIDLRRLNEKVAGEGGFISAKGGQFVHSKTGEAVRFWAVNGPSSKEPNSLREEARMLAKRGVNLARIHHAYYDKDGKLEAEQFRRTFGDVRALKAEGIYTHISAYFPLWLTPSPGNAILEGYDGGKHPFAALYFDPEFQKLYRSWWEVLLTTPDPVTGTKLVDEPAVFGAEIINEDSVFFWTFSPDQFPEPQRKTVETRFGTWLAAKYGSAAKAQAAWGGAALPSDKPAAGRMGFRPLWNIANERTARDRDTAAFLVSVQRGFYEDTYKYLRGLGFMGMICASNWFTASPEVLGPLEKYSYTPCDFVDRHGYFGCLNKGEASEWSIRDGHTYADRSALRFDPEEPGKPKSFVHPSMDPGYDGKPSMISETTWNRPNRYRSEAPLYFAAYGALQGSDAIVHFVDDGAKWSTKPGYFMQPWTLMGPAMMGQFPAAALIFRAGLVSPGDVLVDLDLKIGDLLDLKGTPLPQDASFDELRLKDVPKGAALKPGNVIDPLVHYAGRTAVRFTDKGGPAKLVDLKPYVDRARQSVVSTTGQLRLDYGKGVLAIDAPAAQGLSGSLKLAGTADLKDITVASGMEIGHVIAVSLDGAPLATSKRILLQAMSEEKATGFRATPTASGGMQIAEIGGDPWVIRQIEGTVRFKRADASSLKVTALDGNGMPVGAAGTAAEIKLRPGTLYHLVAP